MVTYMYLQSAFYPPVHRLHFNTLTIFIQNIHEAHVIYLLLNFTQSSDTYFCPHPVDKASPKIVPQTWVYDRMQTAELLATMKTVISQHPHYFKLPITQRRSSFPFLKHYFFPDFSDYLIKFLTNLTEVQKIES